MTPSEAPPGVELRFLPRPSSTGPYATAWTNWFKANPSPKKVWESRGLIHPRLILVHTNGASTEGSRESAYNWSMRAPDNTKPHYQVDRDGQATKFLPSDRRGIANYQADPFSLSIETADLGWGGTKPGPTCGFSPPQAETLAQIIAWECKLWRIPIMYPSRWDGSGVGCHTEPFDYPYWTKYSGKPCPGLQKKIEMREMIMPRAQQILNPPQPQPGPVPPQGEDDVNRFSILVTDDYPAPGYSVAVYDAWDGRKRWIGLDEWSALGYPDAMPQVRELPVSVINAIPNKT